MKRKPGLSQADHKRLAAELRLLQGHVKAIWQQITAAYAVTSPQVMRLSKLNVALKDFKWVMDAAYYKDLRGAAPLSPYFGAPGHEGEDIPQ